MKPRFRFRDSRSYMAGCHYDSFAKSSCSVPAVWTTYSTTPGNLYQIGSYECMNDVVGDRPNPKIGILGFKFHNMSSSKQMIGSGSGQNTWTVQQLTADCSAPDTYYRQFRRVSDGLQGGRQFSGFSFLIDPYGQLIMPVVADQTSVNRCINLSVTKCLSERGRGRSQTNLYETIAELDKSLGMVSSLYRAGLQILPKGKILKRAHGFANAYLLYRYGLKPLVADISHTLLAMNALLGQVLDTSRGAEETFIVSTTPKNGSDAATISYTGSITRTQTVKVRAMSLDSYNMSRADALGLDAKNLLTVPWELLPYSFVFDWFVNAGDFIGSLAPTFGVTQVGSCLSIEVHTVDEYRSTSASLMSPGSQKFISPPSSGTCLSSYIQKTRTVGLPLPGLAVKGDFRLSNLTRALDASALLIQRLGHR